MKKYIAFVLACVFITCFLTACNGFASSGKIFSFTDFKFDKNAEILTISREDGSGTRSAFVELAGVQMKNEKGEKQDATTVEAVILSGTSAAVSTVAGDPSAIGYISMGCMNDTVKNVAIDGVYPSIDTIKSGEYKLARPFNLVTKQNILPVAQDFLDFITSRNGQGVIARCGYIPVYEEAAEYSGAKPAGKVVVAGSSSVTPVMEKLKEAYVVVNPNAEIEIQMNDSSTGISSVLNGICDIGMASRELKESEKTKEISFLTMAMDGISVIVNNNNPLESLTTEELKKIYTGEILVWDEIVL